MSISRTMEVTLPNELASYGRVIVEHRFVNPLNGEGYLIEKMERVANRVMPVVVSISRVESPEGHEFRADCYDSLIGERECTFIIPLALCTFQ